MKTQLSILTLSLLGLVPTPAMAYWSGFNFKYYQSDGVTCKTRSDWKNDFAALNDLPNNINAARLFYSHTCDSLANAVPEAISAGKQILVGLDDEDANFSNEKGALLSAISDYGWDWIVAVSVGSESLYRQDISASSLTTKIHDVRGMLEALDGYPSGGVEVGHVDTTNAWYDDSNDAVIRACDFIGVDVYPYFQTEDNNAISNAGNLFKDAVSQSKSAVAAAGGSASVWITETGWPVNGDQSGKAVAGVSNAASYFQQVACEMFGTMNMFWFQYQDWYASPSFAVVNPSGEQYFSQTCG